jgi:hypothetical protein
MCYGNMAAQTHTAGIRLFGNLTSACLFTSLRTGVSGAPCDMYEVQEIHATNVPRPRIPVSAAVS